MYDGDTFEHGGMTFRVTFPPDDSSGPPWAEEDGHGPVSEWTSRGKRPGELELNRDRGAKRYYDFAEACRIARREGWDAPPYRTGTRKQTAARAARADFEHLRRWCANLWEYVGVVVELADDEGEPIEGAERSLFGIESDATDYLEEVARELAEEIAADLVAAGERPALQAVAGP